MITTTITDIFAISEAEAIERTRDLTRPTIIVSITSPGGPEIDFGSRPDLLGVLHLHFADIDYPNSSAMSLEDADAILDFIEEYSQRYAQVIVHCYEGKSRSAGVAAALQYLLLGRDDIHGDWHYRPNALCYGKMMEAARRRGWR